MRELTMRELLDVLRTATPEERLEFAEWWGELPVSRYSVESRVVTADWSRAAKDREEKK